MKRFFLVLAWALPALSLATEVSSTSTINVMHTYQGVTGVPPAWPTADTVFTLTSGPVGNCFGFWLRLSDPGYQANYASLLAAQISKRAITVYALDTQTWSGSSSLYCLVDAIRWQ